MRSRPSGVTAETARLFVALVPPEPVTLALLAMQPPVQNGVRLTAAEDLHVTLHFLGQQNTGDIAQALRKVRARPASLHLTDRGSFSLGRGRCVLWVGVESAPALRALHSLIGEALVPTGVTLESRPWIPHITIARLGFDVPHAVERDFLRQPPAADVQGFECRSFALFTSETRADGARYRVLESFPLGLPA